MEKEKISKWLKENSGKTGIDNFEIEAVKAGESNHNFIIKTDEEKYVLRVSRKISRESRLENEAEKLEFLESQGIERVPEKIWFSKNTVLGEVLIETFVGENELDKESMTDERLKSLARKMAEIHKIPVSEYNKYFGREESETKNLKQIFREDFQDWSKRPYEEYIELSDDPDQRIIEFYEKQKELVENIREKEMSKSLVHGDLGFNIRATGDEVFVVDWEYSRVDSPDLEIIYCFEHERLDKSQREVFLKEYRKHRDTDQIFEEIRKPYKKFLGFSDMIWAAKRIEQGEKRHRELMENRLDHLEKLYREQ